MPLAPELLSSIARLNLDLPPVAVAFLNEPPSGLPRIDRALPAGCSYWRHAADGHAFYTTGDDHQNCPIGAFTHGVTLSPARTEEVQSLVGTMIELRYLRTEEIPASPQRDQPMKIAAYAPIDGASFDPDVIVFRGNARQIMLITEAARAAGVLEAGAIMGRPACAMLPHASASGAGATSIGCIGNRVYTGLGDDELYFTVPGAAVARLLEQLDTIVAANAELEAFHQHRAETL